MQYSTIVNFTRALNLVERRATLMRGRRKLQVPRKEETTILNIIGRVQIEVEKRMKV